MSKHEPNRSRRFHSDDQSATEAALLMTALDHLRDRVGISHRLHTFDCCEQALVVVQAALVDAGRWARDDEQLLLETYACLALLHHTETLTRVTALNVARLLPRLRERSFVAFRRQVSVPRQRGGESA